MNSRTRLAAIALTAMLMGASAHAEVVYDNGPINGTINATGISSSQAIGNTFTLGETATIASISFGTWSDVGYTLDSVEWGITSAYGVLPSFETSVVTNGDVLSVVDTPFGPYEVREATFLTGGVTLSAGSYYLWLRNGIGAGPNSGPLWDVSNGSSLAYFAVYDTFIGPVNGVVTDGGTGSNSFKLMTATTVPEPQTWALIVGGFGLAGVAMRRRRTYAYHPSA